MMSVAGTHASCLVGTLHSIHIPVEGGRDIHDLQVLAATHEVCAVSQMRVGDARTTRPRWKPVHGLMGASSTEDTRQVSLEALASALPNCSLCSIH
ncbi:hypothetical protein L226DRAFT_265823 [Lentinus tigrinus ALCF2SS1-7]|uniref:uncharacterized protein n=1 Tax=Lentinus tigrinus ALCF2SS1-7 TaxID=1328758 RepID=UPI001166298A|nr:hypothetical protein L226DRAFT_265823 [Lentinus tigrinus ALCF2SS1-7]